MPNRLLTRLAWAATGAAFALTPRLIKLARDIAASHASSNAQSGAAATESTNGAPGTAVPIQQLTRYRHADGTQTIYGRLLAEFATGDRSTMLHVAFCPPFDCLPTVEAEAVDDSPASVNVTQLLHNGVQLEVRRPAPAAAPQSTTIELFATDGQSSS
jgi:hypothetical protein